MVAHTLIPNHRNSIVGMLNYSQIIAIKKCFYFSFWISFMDRAKEN